MATILIDAKVYQVDDEVALHRGVVCDHLWRGSEPVWSKGGDNYMEAKAVSEYIKGRRFIRRPDGTKIIGLSEDVHEALGWHVEAFDKMEKELSLLKDELAAANILIDEHKAALKIADLEHNVTKAELGVEKAYKDMLQSFRFWDRLVRLFKGY